jgi:D-alanine-D-alanine ligase
MKENQHIEIVVSAQGSLNAMVAKSRASVLAVLTKRYTHAKITTIHDLTDLEALVKRRPDLVFLGVKYILSGSTKIWMAQYLDEHHIAYTGSNRSAHELEIDKVSAKRRAQQAGLKTAPFQVIKARSPQAEVALNFPVFIKPTNRCGSIGIDSQSLAYNRAELRSKVSSLTAKYDADSLVEEYLPGREFSVAILKDGASEGYSVMPIELIAPPDQNGARLLCANVKAADTESSIEVTDEIVKAKVNELAIDIFHALGARDYGRIDIRLDEYGTPHFLEANLMPSLKRSDGNYFPKACVLNQGLSYEEMILNITSLGLSRNHNSEAAATEPAIIEIVPSLSPAFITI